MISAIGVVGSAPPATPMSLVPVFQRPGGTGLSPSSCRDFTAQHNVLKTWVRAAPGRRSAAHRQERSLNPVIQCWHCSSPTTSLA